MVVDALHAEIPVPPMHAILEQRPCVQEQLCGNEVTLSAGVTSTDLVDGDFGNAILIPNGNVAYAVEVAVKRAPRHVESIADIRDPDFFIRLVVK